MQPVRFPTRLCPKISLVHVFSLSFEYGEELSWLVPYPGDFHLLMNFQKALMKPYYDAGLKSMAQAAGYPLPAIQTCSQWTFLGQL